MLFRGTVDPVTPPKKAAKYKMIFLMMFFNRKSPN